MRKILKTLLKLGLSLFLTVVLVLAIEGFASLWTKWDGTGAITGFKEVSHCEYDPELGWQHANNRRVDDLYGPGIGLTTNGQHMRGTRDYPLDDDDERYRILCLGDSFTMGYGVNDEDTFPALLAQQHENIETINMGLGGYGIDQCFLWHQRDAGKFDVDVLLFAFIVGDFYRMLPFGNVTEMGKPLLELVDDQPTPINTPVVNQLAPPLGIRMLRLFRRTEFVKLIPKSLDSPTGNAKSIADLSFAPVALRIFEILRDQAKERGQLFTLALLPTQEQVPRPSLPLIDGWLKPELEKRGIPMIDLRPAFKQVPAKELPRHYALGHYTRRGNILAARVLLDGLRELDPNCPR